MIRKILLIALAGMMIMGLTACGEGESAPTSAPTATPIEITLESEPGVNELYQLTDSSQIMSYMLKTKEGSLVMLDGGEARDYSEIIALAQHVTGMEKPVIDAWFFSHSHSDHVNAFVELMDKAPDALEIKKVYYKFTSEEWMLLNESTNKATYRRFMKALKKYDESGANIVEVEEGQTYTYDGVTMEVLLIPDETIEPLAGAAINDASVVYRMTIDNQRVLFLGDGYHQVGDRLIQKYGNDIKSDIVQMAHHGSNGVQKSVYAKIDPKVCLWPTPVWLWENDSGDGYNSGPWETIELNRYMRENLGVKQHIVAKDGMQKLTFPLDLK
ncbi:MAG: MBL fold metallo-hydrolase [Clostridia bacterium]|nr:MBL fold metallo-hydrolase [Clostridia bacterium]